MKYFLLIAFLMLCQQAISQIYVNINASGNNDGTTWADAYNDLQDAIDVAAVGNQIWVAQGTYYPGRIPIGAVLAGNGSFTNRYFAFHADKDLELYGGFVGNETILSQRNQALNPTILSGDIGTLDVMNDNCYHIFITYGLTNNAVIDGFHFEKGNANGNTAFDYTYNNKLYSNEEGGALNNEYSSPTIRNSTFYGNNASDFGGAINNNVTNTKFINCIFFQNSASQAGAIRDASSSTDIVNCTFYDNQALFTGGGGAIKSFSTTTNITNCIFRENNIQGNSNGSGADISNLGSTINVSYSLVQFNQSGTGNIININPNFYNKDDADGADDILGTPDDGLRLKSCSPAINMGNNAVITETADILNQNRFFNSGTIDMGAYEYQGESGIYLASEDASMQMSQSGSSEYTTNCDVLLNISQSGNNPISGNTSVKVWVDNSVQSFNGIPYVQRHYEITPDNNPSSATATLALYFTQGDFDFYNIVAALDLPMHPNDIQGKANLRVTKLSGSSSDNSGTPNTYSGGMTFIDPEDSNITWNPTENRWEIVFDVVGFSGFFIHTGSIPLPVELADFRAEKQEDDNLLTWTTLSETNNQGFHVEHSKNGVDFNRISWLEGNGTTTDKMRYEYLHENPIGSMSYYRLSQLDEDGSEDYSEIISIKNSSYNSINVFPNPTSDKISLETKDELQSVFITDITGRTLKSFDFAPQQISLQDLPSGIYFLRSKDECIKIIKE